MKSTSKFLTTSVIFFALTFSASPSRSQSVNSCLELARTDRNAANRIIGLGRAKNLARQAAEAANGGLNNYRAENSMHGTVNEIPCTDNGNGSWTFTFKGTAPGSTTPIVESVVTVDSQTFKVTVDRNTPLR